MQCFVPWWREIKLDVFYRQKSRRCALGHSVLWIQRIESVTHLPQSPFFPHPLPSNHAILIHTHIFPRQYMFKLAFSRTHLPVAFDQFLLSPIFWNTHGGSGCRPRTNKEQTYLIPVAIVIIAAVAITVAVIVSPSPLPPEFRLPQSPLLLLVDCCVCLCPPPLQRCHRHHNLHRCQRCCHRRCRCCRRLMECSPGGGGRRAMTVSGRWQAAEGDRRRRLEREVDESVGHRRSTIYLIFDLIIFTPGELGTASGKSVGGESILTILDKCDIRYSTFIFSLRSTMVLGPRLRAP